MPAGNQTLAAVYVLALRARLEDVGIHTVGTTIASRPSLLAKIDQAGEGKFTSASSRLEDTITSWRGAAVAEGLIVG